MARKKINDALKPGRASYSYSHESTSDEEHRQLHLGMLTKIAGNKENAELLWHNRERLNHLYECRTTITGRDGTVLAVIKVISGLTPEEYRQRLDSNLKIGTVISSTWKRRAASALGIPVDDILLAADIGEQRAAGVVTTVTITKGQRKL